jgi:AraC-like DNA-binding protein
MKMDTLSDVLRAVRLSGAFFFDVHATGPWVAETPCGSSVVQAMFPGSEHLISYHLMMEGTCFASIDGEPLMKIEAGDIILLPHGDTHVLSSAPGMRRTPDMAMYRRTSATQIPTRISMGSSDGPAARFVCGFLGCDLRPYNPLLAALPRVIHLGNHTSGALGAYFQAALSESQQPRMGGACMLGRISELMFVDAVRRYLETLPEGRSDWLAGLADPYVGRALTALHRSPAKEWSLQELAEEAALSRSALAERFTQFVGQPPMQYLAQWRMQLAANYLTTGNESIASVANRVGYESEAAFSRAFKKATGAAPSDWRRTRVH